MKEVCMQVEDERRHADQFKEQVCWQFVERDLQMWQISCGPYTCNPACDAMLLTIKSHWQVEWTVRYPIDSSR